MNPQSPYKVQLLSQEETGKVLAALKMSPENRNLRRSMVLAAGLEVKGEFELTARDAKSGEVEWTHKSENLITDLGRRIWMDNRFYNLRIIFVPNKETPSSSRSSISTDGNQAVSSANISPSNNSTTNTKTLSNTFAAPASNRTLGSIILGPINVGVAAVAGYAQIAAMALLSPSKTQTTTQTLEVVYKISMNVIY